MDWAKFYSKDFSSALKVLFRPHIANVKEFVYYLLVGDIRG